MPNHKNKKAYKKKSVVKDRFASREQSNYQRPVPSREFILEFLQQKGSPMAHLELCEALDVTHEEEIEGLRRRLIAMCRDGQLMSNRKNAFGLIDKLDLVKGRIQGQPQGHGYLINDQGEDIYISARQMRCVFDGDEVLVRKMGVNFRKQPEGKIIEILQRHTHSLVGRFVHEDGVNYLLPENKRITLDVLIPAECCLEANHGDVVKVDITEQPQYRRAPTGKVVSVMGQEFDPGIEIDIALQTYNIPCEFPVAVLEHVATIQEQITEAEVAERVDLRDKAFVTIDGEDARDFDDAVYASTKRNGGYHLYVAIADVSHYVPIGSALDEHAIERATSVYFPNRVVPMLPEKLSNGLCSLNPDQDRLTLVCHMQLSDQGKIEQYQFMQAVIHSHQRLTYTQVGAHLAKEQICSQSLKVKRSISCLYGLYKQLVLQRKQRGAIEFETVETTIEFNDDKKIAAIKPVIRNEAHKLIEECMLAANECAAKFLISTELPSLFRVHQGPTEAKLEKLRKFFSELAIEVPGGAKPTSADFLKVIEQIKERDDFEILQTMLLRSMNQAVYQPDNEGHFGLGYQAYAHFTSPIRRYPDLMVHRAITAMIQSGKRSAMLKRVLSSKKRALNVAYPYDMAKLLQLGEHCSMCERRADEASWDVLAWLKCEFMRDKVGQSYLGKISGVTNFGLFVQLNEVYVDGLLHVSSLVSDYYHFDEVKHRLIGERSHQIFAVGDQLQVRISKVDLDSRKIDFELDVPQQSVAKKKSKKRKKNKGSH